MALSNSPLCQTVLRALRVVTNNNCLSSHAQNRRYSVFCAKSLVRQFRISNSTQKCCAYSSQCRENLDLKTSNECNGAADSIGNSESSFKLAEPELDYDYLCDPRNTEGILQNVLNRKGVGNIHKVVGLQQALQKESDPVLKSELNRDLVQEAKEIPNKTHPDSPIGEESNAKTMEMIGERTSFDFTPKTVVTLGEDLDCLRTSLAGHTTGPRSYYLKNAFAELEQALIRYTVNYLKKHNFKLVSVPDLLHPEIIEACGFKTTTGEVFKLDPEKHGDVCLSGTAEMALASLHMNKVLPQELLPQKLAAVSRCFRTETSTLQEEQGIYRVRQFTKVEMFGLTKNESGQESEDLFQHFVDIQKYLFSSLGLHFRILDMPTQELGAPAYRKFDMETWMPAKQFWGEISSTSNCTDYQSRRLHIKYRQEDGLLRHVHTVNGTACAVPRMIMAITENNQLEDGTIVIPEALQPYMRDLTVIQKPDKPLRMKWLKLKSR